MYPHITPTVINLKFENNDRNFLESITIVTKNPRNNQEKTKTYKTVISDRYNLNDRKRPWPHYGYSNPREELEIDLKTGQYKDEPIYKWSGNQIRNRWASTPDNSQESRQGRVVKDPEVPTSTTARVIGDPKVPTTARVIEDPEVPTSTTARVIGAPNLTSTAGLIGDSEGDTSTGIIIGDPKVINTGLILSKKRKMP